MLPEPSGVLVSARGRVNWDYAEHADFGYGAAVTMCRGAMWTGNDTRMEEK